MILKILFVVLACTNATTPKDKPIQEYKTFSHEIFENKEEPPTINYGLGEIKPKEVKPKPKKEPKVNKQEVRFTSFYDNNFGSGYSASQFGTNKYGMTIDDQGYVIVGVATNECLKSNSYGCENYNSVPQGFSVFSYGDTFKMYIDKFDVTIDAKVYDSCGACFWNEPYQRVDIHTKNTKLGKIKGTIIYP